MHCTSPMTSASRQRGLLLLAAAWVARASASTITALQAISATATTHRLRSEPR